ncbi:MAG TPA: hypothetical protein VFV08_14395 [Puia sp.]|nr:hypothetical protein [Puia sp.]
MKTFLKRSLAFLLCTLFLARTQAQHIKLLEGNIDVLKNEKSISVEFTYEEMRVGRYDKESDYVNDKTADYNKKEPGKGDTWAKNWVGDRKYRYEPKFNELFEKYSEMTIKGGCKYTLIFKTNFTEPGFNIGITRKSAEINGEAWIVETANKNKVIAKIRVEKAPGKAFWSGNDYDSGDRISEAYATAGKGLGKFIKK